MAANPPVSTQPQNPPSKNIQIHQSWVQLGTASFGTLAHCLGLHQIQLDIQSQTQQNNASKPCNCANTSCLKLYCDCLRNGKYCSPECNCTDCKNNFINNSERNKAIYITIGKKPHSFRNPSLDFRDEFTLVADRNGDILLNPGGEDTTLKISENNSLTGDQSKLDLVQDDLKLSSHSSSTLINIESKHNEIMIKTPKSQVAIPFSRYQNMGFVNQDYDPTSPVSMTPYGSLHNDLTSKKSRKTCKCARSQCIKGYCDCFVNGSFCNSDCTCASCLNFPGSNLREDALEEISKSQRMKAERKAQRDSKARAKRNLQKQSQKKKLRNLIVDNIENTPRRDSSSSSHSSHSGSGHSSRTKKGSKSWKKVPGSVKSSGTSLKTVSESKFGSKHETKPETLGSKHRSTPSSLHPGTKQTDTISSPQTDFSQTPFSKSTPKMKILNNILTPISNRDGDTTLYENIFDENTQLDSSIAQTLDFIDPSSPLPSSNSKSVHHKQRKTPKRKSHTTKKKSSSSSSSKFKKSHSKSTKKHSKKYSSSDSFDSMDDFDLDDDSLSDLSSDISESDTDDSIDLATEYSFFKSMESISHQKKRKNKEHFDDSLPMKKTFALSLSKKHRKGGSGSSFLNSYQKWHILTNSSLKSSNTTEADQFVAQCSKLLSLISEMASRRHITKHGLTRYNDQDAFPDEYLGSSGNNAKKIFQLSDISMISSSTSLQDLLLTHGILCRDILVSALINDHLLHSSRDPHCMWRSSIVVQLLDGKVVESAISSCLSDSFENIVVKDEFENKPGENVSFDKEQETIILQKSIDNLAFILESLVDINNDFL